MKKNRSIKIISGKDAVDTSGEAFPLFLVNFDITLTFCVSRPSPEGK
jgi:hypothetical protein